MTRSPASPLRLPCALALAALCLLASPAFARVAVTAQPPNDWYTCYETGGYWTGNYCYTDSSCDGSYGCNYCMYNGGSWTFKDSNPADGGTCAYPPQPDPSEYPDGMYGCHGQDAEYSCEDIDYAE